MCISSISLPALFSSIYNILFCFMWLATECAYCIYESILLNLMNLMKISESGEQPTKFSDLYSNGKGTCVG